MHENLPGKAKKIPFLKIKNNCRGQPARKQEKHIFKNKIILHEASGTDGQNNQDKENQKKKKIRNKKYQEENNKKLYIKIYLTT